MTVCTTGMLYLVFKKVAREVAEANGYTFVNTPYEGVKKGCKHLIIVDNVNQRVGFIAERWKKEVRGEVVFYAVTEGYPAITKNTGFGRSIDNTIIVTPSQYSKVLMEESGFHVDRVIPHGVKEMEGKDYNEREKKLLYRSYYLKRKFPPYGIRALREAMKKNIPIDIYIRDDMYPSGMEPRHQILSRLLPFKVENSFQTSEERVYNQMSSYLFFLNLSDGGGFELEILENMMLGTPVITAYFPPISEYYPKNELTIETIRKWNEHYPYLDIIHHEYRAGDMLEKIEYAMNIDEKRWRAISSSLREKAKKYEYRKVYREFSKLVS